jgi:type I restriction enzyme, S subunit
MRVITTAVEDLRAGDRRLDGGYHASEGVQALRRLHRWVKQSPPPGEGGAAKEHRADYPMRRLDRMDAVCKPEGIFIPSRFKRTFVDNPEHGAPYLTGISIMQADPLMSAKLLSHKYTSSMDELVLRERMILMTCSGTIGNSVYVNASFKEAVGSPDLLRIEANSEKILPGFLYAYLSSPVGRALIEQKTYGAVVPHIEAHHVVDLPIPRLDRAIEERIHALVERAASLRVAAQASRQKAIDLVSSQLHTNLSPFPSRNLLTVSASQLNWRLEAVYHSARETASDIFRSSQVPLKPIGDLLVDMFYLGKLHRVFVDSPEYGVPLLSIADAQRAKLSSDKFISRTKSRNVDKAILQPGWVLVSRVGSPGLVTYVRREMVGMAGTDHLVRLICDLTQILPGYLYAILSSQVGYKLLVSSAHGSVQSVLPPEYIARIRIPVPTLSEQQPIQDLIERYGEALTLASESEDQAQVLLAEALGIVSE